MKTEMLHDNEKNYREPDGLKSVPFKDFQTDREKDYARY
jgi:hypothetical protein